MAQSVKHLTLGFCSGHDLTVPEFKPRMELLADSVEPAWDSLSLPLSLCPSPTYSYLSLRINKNKLKEKKRRRVLEVLLLLKYTRETERETERSQPHAQLEFRLVGTCLMSGLGCLPEA